MVYKKWFRLRTVLVLDIRFFWSPARLAQKQLSANGKAPRSRMRYVVLTTSVRCLRLALGVPAEKARAVEGILVDGMR